MELPMKVVVAVVVSVVVLLIIVAMAALTKLSAEEAWKKITGFPDYVKCLLSQITNPSIVC